MVNKMMKPLCNLLVLAGVIMLIAPVQAADDKGTVPKAQFRQVQQEKRKLEQDKSQLEQEKAALEAQLKEASATLDSTKGKAEKSSRQSSSLQKELDQAKSDNTELTAKLAAMKAQLEETQAKLSASNEQRHLLEVAKTGVESNLGQRDASLASCIAKNQQEYEYGQMILEKYQKKSCISAMLEREPFFGVAQTRVENEVANDQEQLDRQHIPVPKVVAPVATP